MNLRVVCPTGIELDETVQKVVAEGVNGSFCLLPHHVDYMAILASSILIYVVDASERFVAVDGGVLTKQEQRVLVATSLAVQSADLEALRTTVADVFGRRTEASQRAQMAAKRLEAEIVRRFIDLDKHGQR